MNVIHPRIAILLFTALLATLCVSSVYAGGHRGGGAGPGAGKAPGSMQHMGKLAEKLDLSEAQKKDFAALLEMYRPRFEALAKRGKADRETLLAMAPDDAAYGSLTSKVSDEAGKAAAESVVLMAELQGLVYALLTAEQQQSYLEVRAEQRTRMQELHEQRQQDGYQGKHGHKSGHHCAHKDHDAEACPHKDKGACSTDSKDEDSCPHKPTGKQSTDN
jgi:Spy/CpxP family protein refolding chaperone